MRARRVEIRHSLDPQFLGNWESWARRPRAALGREPLPCSDELIAIWEDKPVDPDSSWPMWRHDARRSGQAHK